MPRTEDTAEDRPAAYLDLLRQDALWEVRQIERGHWDRRMFEGEEVVPQVDILGPEAVVQVLPNREFLNLLPSFCELDEHQYVDLHFR